MRMACIAACRATARVRSIRPAYSTIAAERPEALANTLTDFLDLRETFLVSRRDNRINP